jgi:hypothetical protein
MLPRQPTAEIPQQVLLPAGSRFSFLNLFPAKKKESQAGWGALRPRSPVKSENTKTALILGVINLSEVDNQVVKIVVKSKSGSKSGSKSLSKRDTNKIDFDFDSDFDLVKEQPQPSVPDGA